jgi:fimbrial chaperone protein
VNRTKGYLRRTFAACLFLLTCAQAFAGVFAVNPVRLDLGPRARSGVVTVTNEGEEKLNFQLQVMEWTQDAAGKDEYKETRDLIFFPKILAVEAGEEGIVRVGIRAPAVGNEKTYRLFLEELPGSRKPVEGNGAQINLLIRFGAPIFSATSAPQDNLEIEHFELKKGVIDLAAKNTGNRHQVVKGVHLKGADAAGNVIFALDLADRYLLAGTRKSYTSVIGVEQCLRIAVLSVEFKTDKANEIRKLDVTRAMCS